MSNDKNPAAAGNEQFNILRLYLKDVSFEAPNSPAIFTQEFKPQVNVEMSTTTRQLDESIYEAVLKVSVAAKSEDKTAFLVEIEQAGVFHIEGIDDQKLANMLETSCPRNLFPFAREAVSDLVVKGGFPQLLLSPVNFHTRQQQQSAAAEHKRSTAE